MDLDLVSRAHKFAINQVPMACFSGAAVRVLPASCKPTAPDPHGLNEHVTHRRRETRRTPTAGLARARCSNGVELTQEARGVCSASLFSTDAGFTADTGRGTGHQ